MKFYAYYDSSNIVKFVSSLPEDIEPTPEQGLQIEEIDSFLEQPPFDGAGYNIITKTWQDIRTINGQWNLIRIERNTLLKESDWTQQADVPMSAEKRTEWTVYRQALRNVTNQTDPFNIIWPTKPS